MSFARAKLHRYYDDVSCAPPANKYNPNTGSKVKGAIIDRSKRFSSPKQEDVRLSMESLNSGSSLASLFKTPKHSSKGMCETPKSDLGKLFKTPQAENTKKSKKELFANRTETEQKLIEQINELSQVHTSQLLEKNEDINHLLQQINSLNEKINEQHSLYAFDVKNLRSNYEAEVNRLRKELIDLKSHCEKDTRDKVDKLTSYISDLEENINNQVTINREMEKYLTRNDVTFKEINDKISKMNDDYNLKLENFLSSLELVESVNKNVMENYQEMINTMDESKVQNLEQKYIISTLQEKLNLCKDDVVLALKRCRMFEIVQNDLSKTISVLSKRLMESEVEVENLNDVQQELLFKKKNLEDQVQALSEENENIRQSIDFLQESVIREVNIVKQDLINKLENYKNIAAEESKNQKLCIQEKQKAIDMLICDIDFYKSNKLQLEQELSVYHSKVANHVDEIRELKDFIISAENEFKDKIAAQKGLFNQLSNEYEELKIRFTEEINKLEKRIGLLISDKDYLEKALSSKTQDNQKLHKELEELKASQKFDKEKINNLEEIGYESEKQIEEMAVKLDELSRAADNYLYKIEIFKEAEKDSKLQIEDLEDVISKKNDEIDNLASELDQGKVYVQTVTDHMVSLMNDIAEKDKLIESLNQEKEINMATLIQVSEDYDIIKIQLHEKDMELQKATAELQNAPLLDEVLSELVLEKERVCELMGAVDDLKLQQNNLVDENREKLLMIDYLKEEQDKLKIDRDSLALIAEDLQSMNKKMKSKIDGGEEAVQIGEYMRISQEMVIETLAETVQKQKFMIDKLTGENKSHLDEVNLLIKQVQTAEGKVADLQEEIDKKNEIISDLKLMNQDLSKKINDVEIKSEIFAENEDILSKLGALEDKFTAMEKRKNEYKIYASQMEIEMKQLKEDLFVIAEERDQLKDSVNEHSMKITSLEAQIVDLECRNKEQLDIIGPFKEQLIKFEQERNLLLTKTKNKEEELRSLELAHAKSLGHQNHKQKIKQLVIMKENIMELKKDNERLRSENLRLRHGLMNNKQSAVITKGLKKNKENKVAKNVAPVTSKCQPERVLSPASALRDRN